MHFYLGVELGVEWLCINIGLLFSIFVLVSERTSITVLRIEQSCAWQCGLCDTGVVTETVLPSCVMKVLLGGLVDLSGDCSKP